MGAFTTSGEKEKSRGVGPLIEEGFPHTTEIGIGKGSLTSHTPYGLLLGIGG